MEATCWAVDKTFLSTHFRLPFSIRDKIPNWKLAASCQLIPPDHAGAEKRNPTGNIPRDNHISFNDIQWPHCRRNQSIPLSIKERNEAIMALISLSFLFSLAVAIPFPEGKVSSQSFYLMVSSS